MIRPFINSEACGEFLCLAVRKHLSSFSFKLVATMHSYASNLCATFYDHKSGNENEHKTSIAYDIVHRTNVDSTKLGKLAQ